MILITFSISTRIKPGWLRLCKMCSSDVFKSQITLLLANGKLQWVSKCDIISNHAVLLNLIQLHYEHSMLFMVINFFNLGIYCLLAATFKCIFYQISDHMAILQLHYLQTLAPDICYIHNLLYFLQQAIIPQKLGQLHCCPLKNLRPLAFHKVTLKNSEIFHFLAAMSDLVVCKLWNLSAHRHRKQIE